MRKRYINFLLIYFHGPACFSETVRSTVYNCWLLAIMASVFVLLPFFGE